MIDDMTTNEPTNPAKPEPTKVNIDLPKDLDAIYANMAFINSSPGEMVIDFAQILPHTPRGKVMARVVMSPMHAKILQMTLAHSIATFEQQFGEIKLPHPRPNLAEDFFKFPPEGATNDDSKDDNR